jgi:anthranilate synthase component 2
VSAAPGRVFVVDNYDSFVYNLVQYLGELGADVRVVRNDEVTVEQVEMMQPDRIVISPGPCSPNEAGISLGVIERLGHRVPILGVCLGHQAIGQAYGGKVVHAKTLMHGKTSPILHSGRGVFSGLPNPFTATRYHSLAVERESLPGALEVTAWTEDGEIMGLVHRDFRVEGVQFHPESILTEHGHAMLAGFLKQ